MLRRNGGGDWWLPATDRNDYLRAKTMKVLGKKAELMDGVGAVGEPGWILEASPEEFDALCRLTNGLHVPLSASVVEAQHAAERTCRRLAEALGLALVPAEPLRR